MNCLLTSEGYDNASRHEMHSRDTIDKLRASQDHTGATEHIVDQVHDNEDTVPYLAVPLLDNLEGSMGIRYSDLCHHAQSSHQSDLEAEPRSPPLHKISP